MRSEGELHVQAMRLVCEALADREKTGLEVDWDVINQQLDHMDVILQGIADQRRDDAEQIQILKQERHAAEAKISKLMKQLADAQREASDEFTERQVLTAEQQQDAAAWQQQVAAAQSEVKYLRDQLSEARSVNVDLQGQLNAARADNVEIRRRLSEETDRHRATNAEKVKLFEQKEWADKHAAELVGERDAALAAVSLQRAGIERLQAFVGKVRSVIDNDCDGLEIDEMIKALAELNAGTEPAPATEAAPPPKIDVDFDNAWKRRYGVSAYEQSTGEPEDGQ